MFSTRDWNESLQKMLDMEVPREECSQKHYEAWPNPLSVPQPAWSTSRCLQDPVPSALNSVAPRFAELLLNHCDSGVDSRALPRLTCDQSGGSGAGDAGVCGLVQPPTVVGTHRQPATRLGPSLSTTYRVSPSGMTHTKESSEFPGRFRFELSSPHQTKRQASGLPGGYSSAQARQPAG